MNNEVLSTTIQMIIRLVTMNLLFLKNGPYSNRSVEDWFIILLLFYNTLWFYEIFILLLVLSFYTLDGSRLLLSVYGISPICTTLLLFDMIDGSVN